MALVKKTGSLAEARRLQKAAKKGTRRVIVPGGGRSYRVYSYRR